MCEGHAKLAAPIMGDTLTIDCPECSLYRITGAAAELLEAYAIDDRRKILAKAKAAATPGDLPEIKGEAFWGSGEPGRPRVV